MNKENVMKAISIMKRAKNLDMLWFQGEMYEELLTPAECIVFSEEDLHKGGNTACFAGYIAVSPEFQADGGRICTVTGEPLIYGAFNAAESLSYWLGIDEDLVRGFIYGYCNFYGAIPFKDVTKEHVIEKLEILLKGELKIDYDLPEIEL